MSEIIELQELQKKKIGEEKKLPSWIYTDEKGNTKVNASKLGYEIMNEIPMIRTNGLLYGARFDKKTGSWRIDSLSDFLDGYITDKLESFNKWSQQKLGETKKFIMIKIFDPTMKENPFNNSKPYLANFKNGTYNIKTGELKPHDTKDYILQSHDYVVDPKSNLKPEKAIEWLRDLTGDEKSAQHLMEIIGLSFDEGVTLIGKFEQAGVDSSTMLSKMSKASVVYAKDNLSLQDGLKGTIDSILNAKDETEALRIANEVFGKGSDKMVDAIKRGTFTLDDLAKVAKESGGAVADTFAETEDPIDAANRAMNNAKFALADVGESVQISLLPFFEMAIDALKSFKGWWDSLDQGTKNWIITLAGIAAVIGPALVVIGTLMSSVTKITAGVKDLATVWSGLGKLFGLSGGWFAVAVIAIAALVAGLVWAYNNVEWFRNGVNAFFQGVSDIAVEVFNFMGGYISNIFGGIIQNFQNFFDAGKRIFTGFIDFITGIFTGDWERAWNGVVNIFGGIFDMIAAMAKAPLNTMIGLINAFLGGLNNIKIPKWVPGVGGKGFSISTIPYLAEGGHVLNGQAIVGEAGPELLSNKNGKTTVTPLSDEEKRKGIGGKVQPSKVEQHIHIGSVDANNPSELNKLNRKMYKASQQALGGVGG